MQEADGGLTRSEVLQGRGYDVSESTNGSNGTARRCPECGGPVEGHERRIYCTTACRDIAKAKRAAERAGTSNGHAEETRQVLAEFRLVDVESDGRQIEHPMPAAALAPSPVDDLVAVVVALVTVEVEVSGWRLVCR